MLMVFQMLRRLSTVLDQSINFGHNAFQVFWTGRPVHMQDLVLLRDAKDSICRGIADLCVFDD